MSVIAVLIRTATTAWLPPASMSVANASVHNHADTATWHGHSHIAAHASMMATQLLLQHICDSRQGIVAPA